MGSYAQAFRQSIDDPEGFWGEAVKGIDWYRQPTVVLDKSNPPFYRWFADGVLNTCFNAVDRHVRDGRGDQAALIYDSPVTGTCRTFTYRELLDQVARFAGVLRGLGTGAGDRVVIYMPMIPEAVIAMLACARIGAVHSVVFGGFAAPELAARIDDAAPKVVVSASCGIEVSRVLEYKPILDRAIELSRQQAGQVRHPAAPAGTGCADRRPRPGLGAGDGRCRARRLRAGRGHRPAVHPVHLRHHREAQGRRPRQRRATRSRCAGAWTTSTTPGPARCTGQPPTSAGWSAIPTSSTPRCWPGCTTVLYEGKPVGTPDAGAFWRVIAEHGVKTLFTAPTAFRAIKKEDPAGELARKYDLSAFRYLFLAGERLDPETYRWARELLGIPVIDHWWQTETGWPIAADLMGLEPMPTKPGSPTVPVPGYDVRVVDPATGADVPPGTTGEIVMRLPLPPGCLTTLWGDDQRFIDSYLVALPRRLHHRRRWIPRRRRIPLCHGPHRRRHQRRGPPAVHRGNGRSPRQPSRRCRMRGHRRQ